MLELLEKFKALPEDLRTAISSPEVTTALQNLESKYRVSLAAFIMRVMVKEITPAQFLDYFTEEMNLGWSVARELAMDLRRSVFFCVAEYLGIAVNSPTSNQTPNQTTISASPVIPIPANEPLIVPEPDLIEQAIKGSRLSFSSRNLTERAKNIASTYIKGVRSRSASKDTLLKPVESGGLSLLAEVADDFLDRLDGNAPAPLPDSSPATNAKPSWLSGKPMPLVRDVEYDFATMPQLSPAKEEKLLAPVDEPRLEAPKRHSDDITRVSVATPSAVVAEKPIVEPALPVLSLSKESKEPVPPVLSLPKDVVPDIKPDAPEAHPPGAEPVIETPPVPEAHPPVTEPIQLVQSVEHDIESDAPEAHPPRAGEAPAPTTNWQKSDGGKIIMQDVISKPRVYTPIDELRYFTLKNLRQLSPDPDKAIEMIEQKIQAIVEEDFSYKVEAVTAWKQSPVNRMYLSVCTQALNEGLPIAKCLVKRRGQEADFLTDAEFEAIIKLNQRLSLRR